MRNTTLVPQLEITHETSPSSRDEGLHFTGVHVPAAAFLSSGTPGGGSGSRGRLNSFTQGILPIAFSRQTSQNYCSLEQAGPGSGSSAFEQLQRSR